MTTLNITYDGMSADLPVEMDGHVSDADVRRIAVEVVRTGGVPGMHLAHSETLEFPLHLSDAQARADLLAMTPHGWRASAERREAVIAAPFEVTVAIRYDWIVKTQE